MTFACLGLSSEIATRVANLGYQTPTPIQRQAIPQILQGRDLFASAQTGTGKTASFLLPIIDILLHLRRRTGMPRVIILEPTRELASQVMDNFNTLCKDIDLKATLLVGGEWMADQEKSLKRSPDVLIATPGRLLDLSERGKLLLTDISILTIDEADRMLDMGFIPEVDRIVELLPIQRQTILLSATMPEEIRKLSARYLSYAKEIVITPEVRTAATIQQYKVIVDDRQKRRTLRALLKETYLAHQATIVFCNRKKDVDILTSSLNRHGYKALGLHGDMDQTARNHAIDQLKEGKAQLLIASDIAARGLDVEGINLVINFDVPHHPEDYVHRIGRTGRAGRSGSAYTFVGKKDQKQFMAVEKLIQQTIESMEINLPEEELIKASPPRRRRPLAPEISESIASPESAPNVVHKNEQKQIRPPRAREARPLPPKSREQSSNNPIIGFGDFIPAFILRDPFADFPSPS